MPSYSHILEPNTTCIHCNKAKHCNTLHGMTHSCNRVCMRHHSSRSGCHHTQKCYDVYTIQHTATHCNTLQQTATHLLTTTTHCNTLQHTKEWMPSYSNMSQHAYNSTHYNTLQHTATHLLKNTTHYNTLQHAKNHPKNPLRSRKIS